MSSRFVKRNVFKVSEKVQGQTFSHCIFFFCTYLFLSFFQDNRKLAYASMHGIPMIASSPLRHDSVMHGHGGGVMGGPMHLIHGGSQHHQQQQQQHLLKGGDGGGGPVDVQAYEPPWKALCDFALHSDLEKLNQNSPQYQHLVNQVRPWRSLLAKMV